MTNGVVALSDLGSLGYLRNADFMKDFETFNEDVSHFDSFPQLSIKGGKWAVVQGGERKVMMKPGVNPPEAAQFVEGVMIRINDKSRTYYKGRYDPNNNDPEKAKPTCYSNDGIAPSDFSIEKQNDKCATCRWAAFGTAVDEAGNARKGTACASNARIAIATADAVEAPYLLRAPATSLRPLRDFVEAVRKRGVFYGIFVVRVGFNPEETQPVLTFTPTGALDEATARRVIALREESVVRAICGLDERAPRAGDVAAKAQGANAPAPAAPPATAANALDSIIASRFGPGGATGGQAEAPPVAQTPVVQPAPVAPAAQSVAAPAPVASAPAPVAQAPVVAQPPAVQPSAPPVAPVTVVTGAAGDPLADLNAMLGALDDPS